MAISADRRRDALALPLLLIALSVWGSWLIARTSFVVEGKRWFSLFDDAMISMTYVRNAIEGHGLQWARVGEPVEGFSHPLWLLAMVPSHLVPLAARWRSLPVQVLSLLALIATVLAVRRLVLTHFSPPGARHWLPAAIVTAFYYPLAYWSLMGMETALQALLTVLCVQLVLDAVYQGRDRHLALWIACAAAYLLRMDMLLLVVVAQSFLVAMGGLRRPGVRSWLGGLAVFLLAAGGYEVFRGLYFHALLPNTYYLKLTGVLLEVRLLRGADCLWSFVSGHAALLVLVALGVVPILRRDRRPLLPLGIVASYCAYTVWVGGDAWEGGWSGAIPVRADRFLAFVMPLVFVLGNAGLNAALASARAARWRPGLATAGATVVGLVLANGLWPPGGAQQWRMLIGLERPPLTKRNAQVVADLLRFERLVEPQALVACAWAGIPAYFSDYRMVDLLGYNDRRVAHEPSALPFSRANFREFVPGHNKWDVRWAIEVVRPDAFFQIWEVHELGRPIRVMQGHGYEHVGGFWMRRDSQWVSHDKHRLGHRPTSAAAEVP